MSYGHKLSVTLNSLWDGDTSDSNSGKMIAIPDVSRYFINSINFTGGIGTYYEGLQHVVWSVVRGDVLEGQLAPVVCAAISKLTLFSVVARLCLSFARSYLRGLR